MLFAKISFGKGNWACLRISVGSRKKSQRDFGPLPRVARHELPWETGKNRFNRNAVALWKSQAATPLGLRDS
jgi:hypothetical protein